MGRLDGRVAIVTGAALSEKAAIGAVYAKALAKEGAKVVLSDVNDPGSVVEEITADGGAALGLISDVRDEDSVQELVAKTAEHFGGLDILVNNAAIGSNIPAIPVTEMEADVWDELMAVNVRGSFFCIKAAVPLMKEAGYGKIVNVGSTTMNSGLPDRLHYVTAKGAILAMTRSLSRELGRFGIRINTIAYGLITSKLNEEAFETDNHLRDHILGGRGLGEKIYAEDLCGGLVFLVSPDSDHMTGQCLIIDGGDILI